MPASPAPNHQRNAYGILLRSHGQVGCKVVIPPWDNRPAPCYPCIQPAVLTSTGPSVMGTHSPLTLQVATSPAQPVTVPASMEVDSAAAVEHPGDLGVDTSDIYRNKTDNSPSVKSSCPTPSWTCPWAQSYGGGCK